MSPPPLRCPWFNSWAQHSSIQADQRVGRQGPDQLSRLAIVNVPPFSLKPRILAPIRGPRGNQQAHGAVLLRFTSPFFPRLLSFALLSSHLWPAAIPWCRLYSTLNHDVHLTCPSIQMSFFGFFIFFYPCLPQLSSLSPESIVFTNVTL